MGVAALATGSSARDRAERAFDDQTILMMSMLDNVPLGIGVYDRNGDLTRSNQRLRDYVGLTRLPSVEPATSRHWRGYDADNRPILPDDYPGARALRGDYVTPGIDFLYGERNAPGRWMRISAVPLRREGSPGAEAIVVVQDVDDLKRAAERLAAAGAELASQSRFLDATLSSIPDYVYAFDVERRFAYANPAMLALFDLPADRVIGRTFAELGYPDELAERLNGHIDRVLRDGATVEDEVFFRSPTGEEAYFAFLWGPVRGGDGNVELVVGVSRKTSERRAFEEQLKRNEARLRAATELVGLGIYSWDPATGALDWDDRLRAMWGLPPAAPVDMEVYETGIHPDDLARVRSAIAACVDPQGDGRYNIEYRVIGRDDRQTRHIATSGRTLFAQGRAVGFIGAAIDVTTQRRTEAAVRTSEAQFRSFAEHSSNLIWIADPKVGKITYRSAAFEQIWGVPSEEAPFALSEWIKTVHSDDRDQVERALASVGVGEVAHFEYRIIRPGDGSLRWLRDTSFPIRDEHGAVTHIGGITEDLTREDTRHVYVVSATADEARRLAALARSAGYRTRSFDGARPFLDIAPLLAPGCVLVDLRKARQEALSVARELRARSIALPTIVLDSPDAAVTSAVIAMKAGAIDFITLSDENTLRTSLANAISECQAGARPTTRDETAGARIARLTPRERAVLVGLIEGGTNKTIAHELGISPRTVELHRAQVMKRLNATTYTELLQIAMLAGLTPNAGAGPTKRASK
jgi:PAS domain S-box-containing protein